MRQRSVVYSLLFGTLLLFMACSGPAAPPPPDPPEELFVEENAWTHPLPGDAQLVEPEEFRRLIEAGELALRSGADIAAQQEEYAARYTENQRTLAALQDKPNYLQDLLAAAAAGSDPGDVALELPGGEVVMLEGLATQLENAAYIEELAGDVDNALRSYTLTFNLLPADLQAQLPAPASLEGSSLSEVKRAANELEALLKSNPEPSRVRLDPTGAAPGFPAPHADLSSQNAGSGTDSPASCIEPQGLAAAYWFPLKAFVSPMKNQANRGVCWAFAAIGAIESRERVQNGTQPDLSEQFFANKVLHDWLGRDYKEGYDALQAINLANSKGQRLPNESAWTYNPSPNRASADDGAPEHFVGACDPYGDPDGGWCSETAHQSPRVCTTFIFTFCGYTTMTFGGRGVEAGRAVQPWKSGEEFPLESLTALLNGGHVLMASFPVYEGIWTLPSSMNGDPNPGILTNYDRKHFDRNGAYVDGHYGGHVVQVVGFLSNDDLSTPIKQERIGGGGYFIMKNSWGCGYGDGGYFYVPADYVEKTFKALYVLELDDRRSDAWRREQANPGSAEAPKITVKNGTADLRVPTDLREFFGVSHSVAAGVKLTLSSNLDGGLYDGGFSLDPFLFPVPIERTFTSTGRRTITVRAAYAGHTTERKFELNVVNTPPDLDLSGAEEPHIGETYQLIASVSDVNRDDTAALCRNTSWSAEAPDVVTPTTGCQVAVTFGEEGARSITATTRDSEGATTTATLDRTVLPPPENPYPRILEAGVHERKLSTVTAIALCLWHSVGSGATIDFTVNGCNFLNEPGTHPRYSAYVKVENPADEALTYDWRVYVRNPDGSELLINESKGSSAAEFTPYSPGNSGFSTSPCRITVLVRAPEAARNKAVTVWTGRCSYNATRLG